MSLDDNFEVVDKDYCVSHPHPPLAPPAVIAPRQSQQQQQTLVKRKTAGRLHRHWTKSEQEALYIAVERLGLFGQWEHIQRRMNLDRTTTEIRDEYTRIYAEIPNTDDEESDSEADIQDPSTPPRPLHHNQDQDERSLEMELEWRLSQRLDDTNRSSNGASSRHATHSPSSLPAAILTTLATPALTATSSTTPSARSSQDNIAQLYDQSKYQKAEPFRFPCTSATAAVATTRKISPGGEDDDLEEEDEDDQEEDDEGVTHKSGNQHLLPTTATSSSSSSTLSFPSGETRPPRMIRVWTPEQSENLKNLIEVSFPGSYRINWVWVAAQMGNAFTRKQCKNKWEIMRRRMGTEDEIQLLKRGYQEFGPSWGQIQEKYLPERSRGGISIMWDLLESRGSEQQSQQHQHQQSSPQHNGLAHGKQPHHNRHHSRGASMSSSMLPYPRPAFHSTAQDRGQDRFLGTRTATTDGTIGDLSSPSSNRQLMKDRLQANVGGRGHRASYSLDMSDTFGFGSTSSREQGHHQPHHLHPFGHTAHTTTASDPSSTSAPLRSFPRFQHTHKRHGSETWIDRSLPMTWTEPLSKQLEELVLRHFPHPQKVNWAKISALMGTNPIVSREQYRCIIINNSSNSDSSLSSRVISDFKDQSMGRYKRRTQIALRWIPRKSLSSSASKKSSSSSGSGSSAFMNRFRRTPQPTTMDKIQAKLSTSPSSTPAQVAADKRKAKKMKAKKEASRKKKTANASSLFSRH
ncbi:hypothetical protein BGZ83_007236 [Gryganskiella cystojenkinii]|nr:hypothetical protein BGZ83_007236 [Gryganskiella cystojenkinii]